MMKRSQSGDFVGTFLRLIALSALIAASFWIIKPFLIPILWASTVVIATWPLLVRIQWWLGRRGFAAIVMIMLLLLVLVVPLYFAATALVENVDEITEWSKALATVKLPPLPTWIETLPAVGASIATRWHQAMAATPNELSRYLSPYTHSITVWFLSQVGNLGLLLLQLLLTVIVAAILYIKGDAAANIAIAFAQRLAGAEGEKAARLGAITVRSVALGIVVTAIVQSVLGGIGLLIAGIPFAGFLTALMFVLAIGQIGPGPVLFGATIWLYSTSSTVWSSVFLLFALFCGSIDSIMRPMLIKRGADIPLVLIFAGVIGGLMAFGVIGLFVGPIVLAVAHTLLIDWVSPDEVTLREDRIGT